MTCVVDVETLQFGKIIQFYSAYNNVVCPDVICLFHSVFHH